ncbi:MAG: hypothetical protein H2041_02140 [Phenylobacterium sp.]|uniref:hypothetical protein n=1 Tax=Phenylobacterium sp. TaxID=1871053 RepID=UPI00183F4F5E|nr:hypothetical protein [Phenylobacterium sp.]MBA4792447.1 hypothetical protein [Phenylobacterium sp.]
MMILISAWLAIGFGVLGAVLEVLRNWPDWQWWPFWVVDYVAAGLLIVGGALALRRRGERVLAAGWAFACAMFWMSFFGHLSGLREAVEASAREQRLTFIIGVMFAVTAVGLVLTLLGRSRRGP